MRTNVSGADMSENDTKTVTATVNTPSLDDNETLWEFPAREDGNALVVVGLGGSAGGIPALEAFFQSVPVDYVQGGGDGDSHESEESLAKTAYVVVLHLAPEHESHLAEMLGRSTTLPVQQVTETTRVEAGHIYVIPPGKHLIMCDGTLRLSEPEPMEDGVRVAIDTFFRTLAHAHGPQSVAVVLSGTGADGTLGLRQVKEAGGLTIAQSPGEAEYDAMPRSAIADGMVDYVLPVTAMPGQIAAYWATSRRMRLPAEAAPSPEQREEGTKQEDALRDILGQVRAQTGHNFALYKRATVLRRVGRRMQINNRETLPAYHDFLRTHPAEVGDLVNDLLISVTQFFRDPDAWTTLAQTVLGNLFQGKGPDDEVRVWVCGCATGEEAYTLAMLLLERAGGMPHPPRIQIFATDMDGHAVAHARIGVYPETIAADVSEERLRRWFYRQNGTYQVRKEVREAVLFASHDVLRDTPFSRLDLITCRNLLIYLNRDAQQRVFETFHFALRPEGRLFLGTSESADSAANLFGILGKQHRLYVRRPVARAVALPIPTAATLLTTRSVLPMGGSTNLPRLTPPSPAPRSAGLRGIGSPTEQNNDPGALSNGRELLRSLLERYGLPTVLIDPGQQIAQLSNGAGRFLRVADGEPTRNLLDLVQPGLRIELRTALYTASNEEADQARLIRTTLVEGQPPALVRLTVRPVLDAPDGMQGYFLVQFEEFPAEFVVEKTGGGQPGTTEFPAIATASADVARQLEEEIATLQRQLRSTIEQYEAMNEELKASNEELQAMNEEQRSSTEELETSKEELQSVNEELTTVNHELKARVEEVSRTNSDMQNFLGSTDIGTLFLDRDLRIKRYTPAAEELFNLIPTDTGRPLSDVTNQLDYPNLISDARSVLARLMPVEREVLALEGRLRFLARLRPYRTQEDRIDGVVITFVDITARTQAQEDLRRSEERLRALVTTSSDVLYHMSADWNTMLRLEGAEFLTATEKPSRTWLEQYIPVKDQPQVQTVVEQAIQTRSAFELEHRVVRADGTVGWTYSRAVPLKNAQGEITEWFGAARDVTDRKLAEEALRESEERFRMLVVGASDYAMFLLDEEGRVTFWSTGAERIFGWSEPEVIGRIFDQVFTPEDRAAGAPEQERQTARATGRALDRRWHLRKDGSRFWADGILMRLDDENGNLRGFAKVARDATDQKRGEEAVQQAMEAVADANRELENRVQERTRALSERTEQLTATSEMRQELLRQVVTAQEEERGRISRDLHDDTGQQITALLLGLNNLKNTPILSADTTAQNLLTQLQELAGDVAKKSHRLSFTLRPTALDDLGLMGALQNYAEEWSRWSGVPVEVESVGMEPALGRGGKRRRLPPEIETTIYRVTQEALTNVLRHATDREGGAGASHVSLLVQRQAREVLTVIEDNGPGFDSEQAMSLPPGERRMGLFGMQERARLAGGTLTIESELGQGTSIFLRLPLTASVQEPKGQQGTGGGKS